MSSQPARDALVAALMEWRRHAVAVALVASGFGLAAVTGTPAAYYGAALAAFCVWMAWFVLTTIDFLRRANF